MVSHTVAGADREQWVRYFCDHQENDGLFRDPAIWGEGWYKGDPLWCGRTHLTSQVLERGVAWVKSDQTPDGGLQFIKNREFKYGHPALIGPKDGGAMFPTWFRSLTLALTAKALGDEPVQLVRCPGMQFDVAPLEN